MKTVEVYAAIRPAEDADLMGYPAPIDPEQARRLDGMYQSGVCKGVNELLASGQTIPLANYPKQSSFQKPEEKSSLLNDKPGAISPARVQKLRQKSDLEALSGMQIRVEE